MPEQNKPQSKSLYVINQDYINKIYELEEKDFLLEPEDEEFLAINKQELEQKAVSYLEVMRREESFVEVIDNEIKRLQALKKSKTRMLDRLEESLLNAVKVFGGFTIGLTKFGNRKSETVVVLKDMVNQLPKEYKTIKLTEEPDKKAIKEALKSGVELDGCEIQQNLNLKIN